MDAGIRYMLNVEKRFEDPNLSRDLVAVVFGYHMPDVEEQFEARCDEDLDEDPPQKVKSAPRSGLADLVRRALKRPQRQQTCECS